MNIDLNRGVTIRRHVSGTQVYMYKDAPGTYMNVYGEEVDAKFAKEAGFPVAELMQEKSRKDAMEAALAKINEEYGADKDRTVYEKAGFKVVGLGSGRYQVISPEGNLMSAGQALTEKEAKRLVNTVAKQEE